MAKTKKEKIVDLKPEKITDEQLKKVQETINVLNRYQMEVGQMESRKHELLAVIADSREELGKLQTQFQEEYGTFDVNIQDGVINYPKENGEADKKD
jgi:PP-loop superfamily ATP-utilizing enzyme